ncbi:hypothetical protein Fcan01_25853 [Folsomia candida]|uniref:Uncharacterized protein n=1 Tax=Folsomia candida TaxID=158441 RepID=A0A226D2Z4_FOLCA|nr:hypothetical protein Fcan01_25853 [Folsomia candida]
MLILSSGYESLITMRLILPSELFKIHTVGEFFKVRGYSQIVYDGSLDTEEFDITVNGTDIREEFKKHGLSNLLPKAICTIREQLLLYEYYEMHVWKNSSVGQILNIEERLGNVELHISSYQAGIQPMFQAEAGEELQCRTFPIGGVLHSYVATNVDCLWEIDRFMRHVLGDSGLRPYWAAFFLQFDQMRAMYRSESDKLKSQNLERESSIILSSLAKFFVIWGVAIGTAGIVGSYEIFIIYRLGGGVVRGWKPGRSSCLRWGWVGWRDFGTRGRRRLIWGVASIVVDVASTAAALVLAWGESSGLDDTGDDGDDGCHQESDQADCLCDVEFFNAFVHLHLTLALLSEEFVFLSFKVCIEDGVLEDGVVHITGLKSILRSEVPSRSYRIAHVGDEVADIESCLSTLASCPYGNPMLWLRSPILRKRTAAT